MCDLGQDRIIDTILTVSVKAVQTHPRSLVVDLNAVEGDG